MNIQETIIEHIEEQMRKSDGWELGEDRILQNTNLGIKIHIGNFYMGETYPVISVDEVEIHVSDSRSLIVKKFQGEFERLKERLREKKRKFDDNQLTEWAKERGLV